MFDGSVADVTVESLAEFTEGLSKGEVKLYAYDEEIAQKQAEPEAAAEEDPKVEVVTDAGEEL